MSSNLSDTYTDFKVPEFLKPFIPERGSTSVDEILEKSRKKMLHSHLTNIASEIEELLIRKQDIDNAVEKLKEAFALLKDSPEYTPELIIDSIIADLPTVKIDLSKIKRYQPIRSLKSISSLDMKKIGSEYMFLGTENAPY